MPDGIWEEMKPKDEFADCLQQLAIFHVAPSEVICTKTSPSF